MEDTPHVMLAGAGAEQYARELGMKPTNLLTEKARKAWEKWQTTSNYEPYQHRKPRYDWFARLGPRRPLAGGCTTSGVAYKMHGRVGDSPLLEPACMSMALLEGPRPRPR